jgi:hypothetical protein
MRNRAEGIYDTPDCVFVEPHAPYRPCGIPVRRLRIDPRERSRCRAHIPTALLEGTCVSKLEGELVPVRITPNERGKPSGKLVDPEVVFATDAGPLSGVTLVGCAGWERHDGGKG